jgi:cyclophilin family peptidyl-prolyl cis-trans isomerase
MQKLMIPMLTVLSVILLISGCAAAGLSDGLYASIGTDKGEIIVQLAYDKAPMTVMNFVGLAEGTLAHSREGSKKFYDGLAFHRVEPGFVIQGGCPNGDGTGDPGYAFPDEFSDELKHDGPGVLSMANSGKDTNGSQFFITLDATPWLDGMHSVFGKVVKGEDVVSKIAAGDKIKKVKIIRVGSDAKAFKADQAGFDTMVAEAKAKAEKAAKDKLDADLAVIAKNWPNAVKSPEGLLYVVQKPGSGTAKPDTGSVVKAHYTVHFLDGQKFDSSVERGEPVEFVVGQLLPGLNAALMDMKKGEKRTVIIPPELAYGSQGYPGVIPADAFLVFEFDVIDF